MTTLGITGSLGPFRIGLRTAGGQAQEGAIVDGARPDLAASVAAACANAGLSPEDVEELIVDVGPGSYTGLRVATTFANTCRAFAGVRIGALTSLEIAAAALAAPPPRAVIVLDARRGRWHHATLSVGTRIELEVAPKAEPVADVLANLQSRIGTIDIVADPTLHQALAEALGDRAQLHSLQAADGVTLFDPRLRPRASEDNLEPLYLMGSYAETPHGEPPTR